MDKYEYNLKIDQMKAAVAKEDGATAASIADEFDWKKEKDAGLLIQVADAYELNQEYAKAKEILISAYEKTPTSKNLAYKLTLLAANTKEFDEAMEFYQDFVEIAPRDTSKYILQYRISRAQNMPIEELISILEEFVEDEMEEKWMYELAKLYHEAGYVEKCVDLCDEMSLWFSHGKYVRRALDLKMQYKPLTKTQQDNYNKSDETPASVLEDSPLEVTAEVPIEQIVGMEKVKETVPPTAILKEEPKEDVRTQPTIPFTTIKMDEIRSNLRSQGILEETNSIPVNPFPNMSVTDTPVVEQPAVDTPIVLKSMEETEPSFETDGVIATQKISDTADFEPVTDEALIAPVGEEEGFEQKSIMDLILDTGMKPAEPMREVVPDIDVNEIKIPTPDIALGNAEVEQEIAADIQKFMDTDEKAQTKKFEFAHNEILSEAPVIDKVSSNSPVVDMVSNETPIIEKVANEVPVEEEPQQTTPEVAEGEKLTLEKPHDSLPMDMMTLDPMLKYEADGQIGLDLETPKVPEKELTGQLSIEEVLRSLEQRGILKAETVDQAVEALDKAEAAVNKATVEVAKAEEEAKLNETVVQEISVEDLGGSSADLVDDSNDGFEFTESDDNDAIQQIFNTAEDEKEEVDDEATKEEEIPVELETRPAGTEDIPILDLSFDAPVKKLHPGITPTTDPVAPNTASLAELFADLDEATKKELGLADDEEEVAVNVEDEAEKELEESVEEAMTKMVEETMAEQVNEASQSAEVDELVTEETAETENVSETHDAVEEQTEEAVVEDNEAIADESEVPEIEEETNISETEEEIVIPETEEETEVFESEGESVVLESEQEAEETGYTDEPQIEEETTEIEENTADEIEEDESDVDMTMPKISVSTNENLSATKSLNLDKVVVFDEEMKPFESFKAISGLDQKIKDTVITLAVEFAAEGNSKKGNIMILGDEKSGKTTLAIELIKLINKKRERAGRRIAKVDSSVLNTRGIRSSMKKLVGSDLIVENAQYLRKGILNEFVAISKYYTDDMLIIFEGDTAALKKMRGEEPDIANMFDHLLVIKEYDVKEWVAYAKKYAADENYMIDEMGILALYKAIDDFYGKHQGIDQNDVETIVNRAIKKASKKVTRKLTNLFSGKNDDNGMDILKEADFK